MSPRPDARGRRDKSFPATDPLAQVPSYVIAAGAIALGVAIWIGTSSEPPVRVGDPGIAVEKGELRRMPWWALSKIVIDGGASLLIISGKDDAGVEWTFNVPMRSHPEASAWMRQEVRRGHFGVSQDARAARGRLLEPLLERWRLDLVVV